uniref:NADH-ubiquinone oxidoreductase chain 6 n=1 Tax=Phyllocnistis citrella TaxID=199020 RepID=A0A7M1LDF5_9NEOP|nr:NADH dehydrogenase subunit 6 [Phyllocnistis citrella]QOQ85861.1 NADH dehydrogenase subunit 6 [Phyllocnistis citrella]
MKLFISLILISMTLIMYFIMHPLMLGLIILVQTFFICILSGLLSGTYWFSYILFLTFLGGLLVLFIYVSSIASNEIFFKMNKLFNLFLMILMFNLFMFYLLDNMNWLNFFCNYEMNELFNKFLFFNNENKINISKLYNNQTFLIMFLLINYLFITLIAVVKITNIFFGPLRSNF